MGDIIGLEEAIEEYFANNNINNVDTLLVMRKYRLLSEHPCIIEWLKNDIVNSHFNIWAKSKLPKEQFFITLNAELINTLNRLEEIL
jgi:hypothetical protein